MGWSGEEEWGGVGRRNGVEWGGVMGWNGEEDSTYLHAGIVSDLGVAQHEVLLPLRLQSRVLLAHLTLFHWDVTTCAIGLGTLAGQIVRGFLINMYKRRGRRGGGEEGRRGGREEGRKGGGEEGRRRREEGRRRGGEEGRKGGGKEGSRAGREEGGRRGGREEGGRRGGKGRVGKHIVHVISSYCTQTKPGINMLRNTQSCALYVGI